MQGPTTFLSASLTTHAKPFQKQLPVFLAPLTLIPGIGEEGELATLLRTGCSTQKLSLMLFFQTSCLSPFISQAPISPGEGCWAGLLGESNQVVQREDMVGGQKKDLLVNGKHVPTGSESWKTKDDWVPASP